MNGSEGSSQLFITSRLLLLLPAFLLTSQMIMLMLLMPLMLPSFIMTSSSSPSMPLFVNAFTHHHTLSSLSFSSPSFSSLFQTNKQQQSNQQYHKSTRIFMKRNPFLNLNLNLNNNNKKEFEEDEKTRYLKEMKEAAKDPILFEAFVMKYRNTNNGNTDATLTSTSTSTTTTPSDQSTSNLLNTYNTTESISSSTTTTSSSTTLTTTQKRGYVPIEQWEQDQQSKSINKTRASLSWEEQVQFDGQRFGNKFQQNEILRKNLKGW